MVCLFVVLIVGSRRDCVFGRVGFVGSWVGALVAVLGLMAMLCGF